MWPPRLYLILKKIKLRKEKKKRALLLALSEGVYNHIITRISYHAGLARNVTKLRNEMPLNLRKVL